MIKTSQLKVFFDLFTLYTYSVPFFVLYTCPLYASAAWMHIDNLHLESIHSSPASPLICVWTQRSGFAAAEWNILAQSAWWEHIKPDVAKRIWREGSPLAVLVFYSHRWGSLVPLVATVGTAAPWIVALNRGCIEVTSCCPQWWKRPQFSRNLQLCRKQIWISLLELYNSHLVSWERAGVNHMRRSCVFVCESVCACDFFFPSSLFFKSDLT